MDHFLEAQALVYDLVIEELRDGEKQSHWMWFIFPQVRGLGRSATAERYAINSLAEARRYLDHPVLGARLRECLQLVLAHRDKSAHDIFGSPDDLKLRSCLTLFAMAAPDETLFGEALDCFFDGQPDPLTIQLLAAEPDN